MPIIIRAKTARALRAVRIASVCAIPWSGAALLVLAAISACSTEGAMSMRPDVDVGVQTATVIAPRPTYDVDPTPPQPAETTTRQIESTLDMQAAALSAAAPPKQAYPQSDAVSLAPVEIPVPVEETEVAALPVPRSLPEPALAPAEPDAEVVEPAPPRLAAYPRFVLPRQQTSRAEMPADEIACRRALKRLGVVYSELPPIHESRACGIDHPVKVSALSGGIRMQPPATLNCEMAVSFARWTKNELAPSARYRYLSGVGTIHQASSYSCRNINGTHTSSEHSRGNALDVSRIELKNGRDIDVRKPGWFAFRQRGFLNTVRSDGCEYFTTVLGPGYNYDHRNHFHFDIKPRRNGHRACR